MNKVDELLEFLATREGSYTLDEVSRSILIPKYMCRKIVHFLAKYGFVCLNDTEVKINPKMKDFVIATSGRTFLQLAPSATTRT